MTSLIENTSDKLLEQMKQSLRNARRVAVTCDAWSGKNSTNSYLGVTAHFQDSVTKERKSLKIGKYLV